MDTLHLKNGQSVSANASVPASHNNLDVSPLRSALVVVLGGHGSARLHGSTDAARRRTQKTEHNPAAITERAPTLSIVSVTASVSHSRTGVNLRVTYRTTV